MRFMTLVAVAAALAATAGAQVVEIEKDAVIEVKPDAEGGIAIIDTGEASGTHTIVLGESDDGECRKKKSGRVGRIVIDGDGGHAGGVFVIQDDDDEKDGKKRHGKAHREGRIRIEIVGPDGRRHRRVIDLDDDDERSDRKHRTHRSGKGLRLRFGDEDIELKDLGVDLKGLGDLHDLEDLDIDIDIDGIDLEDLHEHLEDFLEHHGGDVHEHLEKFFGEHGIDIEKHLPHYIRHGGVWRAAPRGRAFFLHHADDDDDDECECEDDDDEVSRRGRAHGHVFRGEAGGTPFIIRRRGGEHAAPRVLAVPRAPRRARAAEHARGGTVRRLQERLEELRGEVRELEHEIKRLRRRL